MTIEKFITSLDAVCLPWIGIGELQPAAIKSVVIRSISFGPQQIPRATVPHRPCAPIVPASRGCSRYSAEDFEPWPDTRVYFRSGRRNTKQVLKAVAGRGEKDFTCWASPPRPVATGSSN